MPRLTRLLAALLLGLAVFGQTLPALAHKVNVYAYVDGPNIMLECFFNKTSKVHDGAISVLDTATGEVLATGTTDENGSLSLPVPPKAIASGHDLKILLKAGEGHQSDTLVKASEFAGLKPAPAPAKAAETKSAPKPEAKPNAKAGANPEAKQAGAAPALPQQGPQIDEAMLTRIVEQAVDSRLAPVKRLLMEAAAPKGPSFTEIAGGIGYIFGLCGIAALIASRRKNRAGK